MQFKNEQSVQNAGSIIHALHCLLCRMGAQHAAHKKPGCSPLDPVENVSILAHNCLYYVNDDAAMLQCFSLSCDRLA